MRYHCRRTVGPVLLYSAAAEAGLTGTSDLNDGPSCNLEDDGCRRQELRKISPHHVASRNFGRLSQSRVNCVRNTTVNMCACTVFVYNTISPGGEVKHIDLFDGKKTVSLLILRVDTIPNGALTISESIGDSK
jgi:hypothetical protein